LVQVSFSFFVLRRKSHFSLGKIIEIQLAYFLAAAVDLPLLLRRQAQHGRFVGRRQVQLLLKTARKFLASISILKVSRWPLLSIESTGVKGAR
jgi:hypothetical protein